jgi:hypothetical protein
MKPKCPHLCAAVLSCRLRRNESTGCVVETTRLGAEVGRTLWRRRRLFRSSNQRRARVRHALRSLFHCNILPSYCGAGGMHTLPRSILTACDPSAVVVRAGVRVSSVEQCVCDAARWSLYGVGGAAAFHDTTEEQAQAAHTALLGNFDVVRLV